MMKLRQLKVHSLILVLLFFFPVFLFAQQGSYHAYELSLEEYPSPGKEVQVSIRSNQEPSVNIRSVQWFINGEEKGSLANKLSVPVLASNSPKQIIAKITYFNAFNQRKNIEITAWMRPAIFDILWEADSVATPGYRGHHLAWVGAPIHLSSKIQFIDSDGEKYTEEDFSFRWEIESRFHEDTGPEASHVIYEPGGRHSNDVISVHAEATLINKREVFLEKRIEIPMAQPRILLYSHTLLGGLLDTSVLLQETPLEPDKSVTLSVYPFFFSKNDFERDTIQYEWFIDKDINPLKKGRKIDISLTGGSSSIPIRIHAANENIPTQKTSRSFIVGL